MKIKELIDVLNKLDQNKEIKVSSDEELNTIFNEFEIGDIYEDKYYCIYGLSGSEVEE